MLDSTARAERLDLTVPEAPCFTWEVAQKPVAVRLPMPLIDRLETEAVETFRSLTSRGSEIGGLLLGSHAPGSPAVVTVSDFQLVPCDYTRGPLYRLADADMARFAQAIEKLAGNNATHVIGFFRSHTRKGLTLDAEDLAFFEPRFPEPHQIALLIRPFATKVSTAGIFIRENGRVHGESSYREFSFRSSELVAGNEKADTATPPSAAAPAAAQPAAPPKPQSRAQIVPIASRREITLPEPVVAAPGVPPVVADKAEAAAPAPAPPAPTPKSAAPAPVVESKPQPAARIAEKEEEKVKEKEVSAVKTPEPRIEPVSHAAEAPADIVLPVAPAKSKKLRLVVAAAVGMLVLGGGGLIVYPTLVKKSSTPHGTTPQDTSPLSLRVERTSGGMLLTWNRDLQVIQSASKVVLSITDGDRHENIQLDPNQVRTGSILYPPMTGDVSFQMEVTDPHQTKTTSESLRVLDPRPSPLDVPAAGAPGSTTAKESTPAKPGTPGAGTTPTPAAGTTAEANPPAGAAPATTQETKTDDSTSHPAANLKPFNAASLSLAQRLRPVSSSDLPEEPPVVRATPAAANGIAGIINSQQSVPLPPKPVVPTPAPAPKVGGQLTPAKVISRVDPEYPKLARQAGASGLVELEATISTDGRVKNPRVVRGNSMLQKAAIDAVLQWRYQPAMLNGKPVESPVEIKLNFVTQGR